MKQNFIAIYNQTELMKLEHIKYVHGNTYMR